MTITKKVQLDVSRLYVEAILASGTLTVKFQTINHASRDFIAKYDEQKYKFNDIKDLKESEMLVWLLKQHRELVNAYYDDVGGNYVGVPMRRTLEYSRRAKLALEVMQEVIKEDKRR